SAEVIKIPEPIIEPITIIVASIGPRARTKLVWTFVGETVGFPRATSSSPIIAALSIPSVIIELETARPRAEEILFWAVLKHQIIYCSAIRPHLDGLNEPRPRGISFNVMPFFRVVFTGSKIAIEVIRLPDWLLDPKRRRDAPRTHTFPHLHPIRHAQRIHFRPREKMHMIRH